MDERVIWGKLLFNAKYPDEITYLHPVTKQAITVNDWRNRKRKKDDDGIPYIEVLADD